MNGSQESGENPLSGNSSSMAHIPARWKNVAITRGDGEQERDAKRARIEAPPEARGVLTDAVDSAFQKILAVSETRRQNAPRGSKLAHLTGIISRELTRLIASNSFKAGLLQARSAEGDDHEPGDVRCVPKAYEDANLRQPMHADELACVRAEECECMFIDPAQPFVGVRYALPWETDTTTPGLSLPCKLRD